MMFCIILRFDDCVELSDSVELHQKITRARTESLGESE